ncbi:MAG: BphX family protein [Saprospirales bacterium]|jgi:hypothetical protein|nr:BphX family protein [Saprospirales bacterium]
MKKLKWWMIIVGGFYSLLTAMNLIFLFVKPDFFAEQLPPLYAGNELAASAFSDAWLVFVFELGVLGGMLLYASGKPEKSRMLVLTVIFAEVFRGIVADAVWIGRGYAASEYIPFIVIHLLIIVTGWLFLRQAGKENPVI